jgi:hypothetical protein
LQTFENCSFIGNWLSGATECGYDQRGGAMIIFNNVEHGNPAALKIENWFGFIWFGCECVFCLLLLVLSILTEVVVVGEMMLQR